MNNDLKSDAAYKTIGEISKELGLVDKKTGNSKTYVLRYWETQFKQIKPLIKAGKRRYYSKKDFKIIKIIKFLLKERGLTISGAKKILDNQKDHAIDDNMNLGIYKQSLKSSKIIKDRVKKISNIIKQLKKFE